MNIKLSKPFPFPSLIVQALVVFGVAEDIMEYFNVVVRQVESIKVKLQFMGTII